MNQPLEFPFEWGVSRETMAKLHLYKDLLEKWQSRINLVSSNTIPESWERHFIDSAQLINQIPPQVFTLTDLGSGGGFPGMVLAILRPEISVSLVESDEKKCAFLQTVSRETKTPVKIFNQRIEVVSRETRPPDMVTARALAPLSSLLDYCEMWVAANPNLVCLFPKGENYLEEVVTARKSWSFTVVPANSMSDPGGRLLCLSNLSKNAKKATGRMEIS